MGMQEHLLTKVARDLTPQEAFDLFFFLVEQGGISITDKLQANEKDEVTNFRPGARMNVVTNIAGVDFLQARGTNPGPNGSAGAIQPPIFRPTQAFAIVLYRLAVFLSDEWDVTKIVWGGITSGSGANDNDCHNTGRCVDFYGATTASGQQFDVRRDWWLRPVFRKDNHKPHATVKDVDDRWGNDTSTYYRLAISTEPQDETTWRFFADVYKFAMAQCTVAADVAEDVFRNGDALKEGTIFHPDYPFPGIPKVRAGRRGHNDHMHFQLGNAFG